MNQPQIAIGFCKCHSPEKKAQNESPHQIIIIDYQYFVMTLNILYIFACSELRV